MEPDELTVYLFFLTNLIGFLIVFCGSTRDPIIV